MARIARVAVPGFPHYVTYASVRSMGVFFGDGDRADYVRLMAE